MRYFEKALAVGASCVSPGRVLASIDMASPLLGKAILMLAWLSSARLASAAAPTFCRKESPPICR